jgi:hypothetical protein
MRLFVMLAARGSTTESEAELLDVAQTTQTGQHSQAAQVLFQSPTLR